MNFVYTRGMSDWIVTTGISSAVTAVILKNNGPYINYSNNYDDYKIIYKILLVYFAWDSPKTWDHYIHHQVNFVGIFWCMLCNRYYDLLGRMIMYEMTTPWLGLYMITKNKLFIPVILITYSYYRIYNSIEAFYYINSVDMILACVHIVNTILNFYWFSKIIRKCYVKLLQ